MGTNEIAALVAPAWFSGRFGLRGSTGLYGQHVGVLAQLEVDQVAVIREAVQQAVAVYFETGAMSFPAQALIVSGQKH